MIRIITLILTGLFSLLSYSFAEIVIKISTDKTEYLEGENIICNLSFINNSDLPDSIDYDKFCLCYVKIKSPENKIVQYTGGIGDWVGSIPYFTFEPRGVTSSTFILNDIYVDQIVSFSINSAPGYLSSGTYNIMYNFGNRLTSNEIVLNINKPVGFDSLVFEKLITAYKIYDMRPGTIDSIFTKKEKYYEIARSYPESIYWEEAVYRYNQVCNWLNLAYTDIDINKACVEKFPNSIYVKHILINLCQAIYHYEGGESVVIIYLQNLIENYPNSNVSMAAKEQLLKKEYLN